MATILVVDDHPTNRQFLVTLLGYYGHRLLEASDGAEALTLARAERPDLIISDILMPTMDGYEFMRQLCADPEFVDTHVIFSTAHYLDHEASALAEQCGVSFILPKPCEPDTVLRIVEAALSTPRSPASPSQEGGFDREHLRLLTDQLAHKADELLRVNQKLTALIDLGQHLVWERDPRHLLEEYCRGARDIIGAKWVAVGVLNDDPTTLHHCFISGLDRDTAEALGAPSPEQGVFARLLGEGRPCRLRNPHGDPQAVGLPPQFPPVYALLGVPLIWHTHVYGWLCLADKLGADEFGDEDEHLAGTLAAQMAVAYENAKLYSSAQRRAAELEQEVAERRRVEAQIRALTAELEQRVAERTAALQVANEELAAFSYSVSHDLRAPLRAMHGYAHILLEEYGGRLDSEAQGYLQRIMANARRMGHLIDALLTFAQLGHKPLQKRPVALADLVREVLESLRPEYAHRQVDLAVEDLPVCQADPALLTQVWANLLQNALKFTRQRQAARIEVGSYEQEGQRVYFVRDNGAGFDMRYADKLFGVFQRLHRAEDYEGTGVGLALAQRIVQRHGGRIWAEAAVGQGATFAFTLGA